MSFNEIDSGRLESVGPQVLDFYRDCPFNAVESPDNAAKQLKNFNLVQAHYPDLHRHLSAGSRRVLEAGSGVGWLSTTMALHYGAKLRGIDFNPTAVGIAQSIAAAAGATSAEFSVMDLFKVPELPGEFDIVISIGVLHHTGYPERALGGLAAKVSTTEPGARLYIGLYHSYGRRPFLQLFEDMKQQGASDEEMLEHFALLHGANADKRYLWSRFRDQVLHPHETQHSLEEVVPWLDRFGFALESTSINQFKPITSLDDLYREEQQFEALSYKKNVTEKTYFPGFFTVCAKRK